MNRVLMNHKMNEWAGGMVQGWRDIRSGTDIPRLGLSRLEFRSPVKLCGELRDLPGFIGGIVKQTGEFLRVWDRIWDGGLRWVTVGNEFDVVRREREMHGRAERITEGRQLGGMVRVSVGGGSSRCI